MASQLFKILAGSPDLRDCAVGWSDFLRIKKLDTCHVVPNCYTVGPQILNFTSKCFFLNWRRALRKSCLKSAQIIKKTIVKSASGGMFLFFEIKMNRNSKLIWIFLCQSQKQFSYFKKCVHVFNFRKFSFNTKEGVFK